MEFINSIQPMHLYEYSSYLILPWFSRIPIVWLVFKPRKPNKLLMKFSRQNSWSVIGPNLSVVVVSSSSWHLDQVPSREDRSGQILQPGPGGDVHRPAPADLRYTGHTLYSVQLGLCTLSTWDCLRYNSDYVLYKSHYI